ncbi:hypothetical protein KDH_66700 [Dictyobacter sp. S3.2.2.5]|uniref:DUF7779 domain-containing protein n=1 Tax=Dictyobacter halimunensis TaxID=3026934 RepID=A0ABQ6G419_9CHLR|nr:hypothetical protein KDH_66700 [Dictyobacter sp. S3.2.2.5]
MIIEAVKRWLQQHDGWLLILDNVESLSDLEGVPPVRARGHTLITTRSQAFGNRARHIDLETMPTEEGALLLLRRANVLDMSEDSLVGASEADQALAREIARDLGGLPLALDQAGAYIEETQCGLQGYLDLYRRRNADLLRERGEAEEEYPETVATTWSLSFEKVRQASAVASDFLTVCALLDPDAIPRTLFERGAQALGPELMQLQGDELAFNAMMRHLLRYSLLRRNPNQTLTIHRLVQIVLQSRMSQQERQLWSERVIKALALSLPPANYEQDHWSQCLEYVPQVQCALELVEQQQFSFIEVAQLLRWLGKVKYEQARYQEVEPSLQRALTLSEQIVGFEHPLVATILNDLAELYREQAKYQAAELLYLQALQIREKVLGESDPDTATSLNNLAVLYKDQGRYGEAEPLYERALQILEEVLGGQHPNTATSLNNLAVLYQDQGRYEEAEPLLMRALQICEEVLGGQHPNTAMSVGNLARWYQDQGRYEEAEPLLRRALQVLEEVLGGQHPDTATSLNKLALLYKEQGRLQAALPLYKKALAIQEHVWGEQHPDIATSLNNLATLYAQRNLYSLALPLLKRSLAICEQVLGAEHPDTQRVRENYEELRTRIRPASGGRKKKKR